MHRFIALIYFICRLRESTQIVARDSHEAVATCGHRGPDIELTRTQPSHQYCGGLQPLDKTFRLRNCCGK